MKGILMSIDRKDPIALKAERTAPHTSQEEKNNPPSYTQQPAVSDDVIQLTPTRNTSQTRIWYIGHVFVCVADVGGLLGFSSQNQTTYFMI